MERAMTKQIKKVLYAIVCGVLLLADKTIASAATEAVYEYDVKLGENNVYRGIVNTDGLNVRSAAGKNNPVVQINGKGVTLSKQDEVAILDEALNSGEKWYKVSFRRGETLVVGYVHGSYIELTTDVLVVETVASTTTEAVYEYDIERGGNNVYRGIVNTDGLNVRSAAGKNNPVVKVNGEGIMLNKQDEVAVLDETLSSGEKWYKVSFRRGETLVVGYVHGSYVELTADVITPLPTLSLDPLSASADSMIDSQAEESGGGIGFWIAVVGVGVIVVAILILCIKDRISNHSYSSSSSSSSYNSGLSGSSYDSGFSDSSYSSDFSDSSYSGGFSDSSYNFNAHSYIHDHCVYLSGIVHDSDIEYIKNDPCLTTSQKEAAIDELKHQASLYDF